MADGRVVARGGGDTATGTFSCVVRRALVRDRLRYQLQFDNDGDAAAELTVRCGDSTLQTLSVSPHADLDVAFTLPNVPMPEPIVVDVRSDGTTMRIVERRAARDETASPEWRRLVLLAAGGAALAMLAIVAAAALAWRLLLWRSGRATGIDPPPRPAGAEQPEAAEAGDSEAAVVVPAPLAIAYDGIEVLNPEQRRPERDRNAAGFTYEAPPFRDRTAFATIAGAVVTAVVLVLGFVFAHPHVGELGAPNEVLQGSAIDVPYESSGVGSLQYRVVSSGGTVVAGGTLDRPSGTLHVGIPVSAQDETYLVRLQLNGPLGDASNEATVAARAVPKAQVITRSAAVPAIRSFAVTRTGGKTASIVAFYDVVADRGSVRLVDTRGIQYGESRLSAGGQSRFILPDGVDAGTLAVVLHAVRSGHALDARIGLPSGDGAVAVATSAPRPGPIVDEGAPIVVPPTSVGADPIHVRILHHYPGLHIALIDGHERKLVGLTVAATARDVVLAHPPVSVATRVTVEATYRENNESDVVIRPVILVPASRG